MPRNARRLRRIQRNVTIFAFSTVGIRTPIGLAIREDDRDSDDWHKAASSGGTSTGGVYTVSGTIGQHDAGEPMTGGNFSLTGGFWALYAVQTPGTPVLSIRLTTTNTAMVYWTSPSTGYNLQVNTNLATANWVTPAETVQDNDTIKFIPYGKIIHPSHFTAFILSLF
jgi:hypothetical protein